MNRFLRIFTHTKCNVIGMIHVNALPGTPRYSGGSNSWQIALEKAKHEANIYAKYKMDSVLLENMHDIPYVQERSLGPEIVACMARLATEVRKIIPKKTPCGIQILACGNRQALAVAKACDLQYIRAEAFVFGHVADEGYADACAGELLRYRKSIDAENVLVFTDLKKKHSSHAITQDVNLLETAKAAEFFLTDGIVITGDRVKRANSKFGICPFNNEDFIITFLGDATGHPARPEDIAQLVGKVKSPLLVGSGVTFDNIEDYFTAADAVIIGSHFKVNGNWKKDICEQSVDEFMRKIYEMRKFSKNQ